MWFSPCCCRLWLEIARKVDALILSIGGQTTVMTGIADQIAAAAAAAAAADEARQGRESLLLSGDLQAMLSSAVSGAIEAHGVFRPPLVQPSVQGEGQLNAENLNPNDFTHLGTLISLFNVALNDLSVITTRLLASMLEESGSSKEDVRAFITGLLDAYTAGDKNVFFRALHQRLEASAEHLTAFKALTLNTPDVRRDVSKILREAEEIMSMVQRCDRQNLIRIVFEGGELWSLQQYLIRYFDLDGDIRDLDGL